MGSATNLLKRGMVLFYSGASKGERHEAGVGLLITFQLGAYMLGDLADEYILLGDFNDQTVVTVVPGGA